MSSNLYNIKGLYRILQYEESAYLGDEFYDEIARRVGYNEVMRPDQNRPYIDQIKLDLNNCVITFLVSCHKFVFDVLKIDTCYLYLKYNNIGKIVSISKSKEDKLIYLSLLENRISIAEEFIKLLNEKGLTLEPISD